MLKNKILTNYDDINVKIRKYYIAFISKTNFVDIRISKKDIKIWLNLPKGKLNDPQNIARDVSAIGHWGNGDYELILKNDDNIEYIMYLIKQAYEYNKK